METSKPGKIVLLILGVLMLAGWALVIWVAMQVTHAALETLAYIVDLAQYTPSPAAAGRPGAGPQSRSNGSGAIVLSPGDYVSTFVT